MFHELHDNFSKSDLIGNILLVTRGFDLPKEIWCAFAGYYVGIKDKLIKELLGEVNALWVVKKLITVWKEELRYELISLHINPDYNQLTSTSAIQRRRRSGWLSYDTDHDDTDHDDQHPDYLKIIPKDITNAQRKEFFEYTSTWNVFSRFFDSLFGNNGDHINIITAHTFTTIFRIVLFFIYSKVQKKWYILGSLFCVCILGGLGVIFKLN